MTRRILNTNRRSPGDVVAMTAAVRDLALSHAGEFKIHVGGSCPELCRHNPHVAGVWGAGRPGGAEFIEPDIRTTMRESGAVRRHYLTAYHGALKRRLNVRVPTLRPHGDLHLSDEERESPPAVPSPYWVMIAGGKRDMPVKMWSTARFKGVAAALGRRGIRVVRSGAVHPGHVHPRVPGTTDLRGKPDLRAFLPLVHLAQGVICPVTFAMHVAAAFQKPCVVLAGGRANRGGGRRTFRVRTSGRGANEFGFFRSKSIPFRITKVRNVEQVILQGTIES